MPITYHIISYHVLPACLPYPALLFKARRLSQQSFSFLDYCLLACRQRPHSYIKITVSFSRGLSFRNRRLSTVGCRKNT